MRAWLPSRRSTAHQRGACVIAFPGQRVVSAGIRVTGGDNVGDIYCVGSVHGNTIEGASGHGIAIDAGCDYLSIGPNAMVALGSSSRAARAVEDWAVVAV